MFQSVKTEPEESHLLVISDNESDNSGVVYRPLAHQRATPHKDINTRVRQYFTTLDPSSFFCNICERQFKGTVANMKAHLGSIHREILDEINNSTYCTANDSYNINHSRVLPTPPKQEIPTSSGLRTRKSERFDGEESSQDQPAVKKLKKDESHRGLIEFMVDGGNLKVFELISGQKISRQEVQKIFALNSTKICEKIKNELEGKFPFYTIAITNKICLVTAHFIEDMKLKVRHLGFCDSKNLQLENKILKSENVKNSPTSMLLKKFFDSLENSNFSSNFIVLNPTIDDKNLILIKAQKYLNSISKIFSDFEPKIIEDVQRLKEMEDVSQEKFIHSKNSLNFCGSRLLRNIAKKITKKFEENCEEIQKIVDEMKSEKIKIVDENRWDFTLIFFEEIKNFEVITKKLQKPSKDFIVEYLEVFNIVRQTIREIDNKNLLFGDFFLKWTLLEIKLGLRKDEKFGIAKSFVDAMKNDEEVKVFNWKSGNFHANFFLDPRFKYSIDDEVFNIKAQHSLIEFCLSTNEKLTNPSSDPQNSQPNQTSQLDDELPIEYKLLFERTGGNSPSTSTYKNSEGLRQKLKKFGLEAKKIVKPGEKFDVLDYWNELKDHQDYKDILPIAEVILANPASRVEILNDFSAFSLAILNLNGEISFENLNDFAIVCGNLDLVE